MYLEISSCESRRTSMSVRRGMKSTQAWFSSSFFPLFMSVIPAQQRSHSSIQITSFGKSVPPRSPREGIKKGCLDYYSINLKNSSATPHKYNIWNSRDSPENNNDRLLCHQPNICRKITDFAQRWTWKLPKQSRILKCLPNFSVSCGAELCGVLLIGHAKTVLHKCVSNVLKTFYDKWWQKYKKWRLFNQSCCTYTKITLKVTRLFES